MDKYLIGIIVLVVAILTVSKLFLKKRDGWVSTDDFQEWKKRLTFIKRKSSGNY